LSKAAPFQDLSLIPPEQGQDKWRWLYSELRAAILEGRLRTGARLPSSRNLARQYQLSRGTVLAALEQLRSEGYTDTQVGAGTFVASSMPDRAMAAVPRTRAPQLPESRANISNRANHMIAGVRMLPPSRGPVGRAFRSYEPALDLFPVQLWARTAGRVLRHAPRALYGQGHPSGYEPLRKAIAEYVGASRGVRCTADQIIVTAGAQQALDLVTRMLLDPGDRVWVEDPGYPGARLAVHGAGALAVPVPVDRDGMHVDFARANAGRARMAYVTPANQFPLGVTMSLARRLALLNWAVAQDAWIVEDEYDAEYRYCGRPAPALQSLDRSGCVVYIGTFTKMLFNALRIGFVVLPQRLVEPFAAARSIVDRHPPTLDQAILSEFISEGHFGHHVRRMRQVYMERLSVLMETGRRHLAGRVDIQETAAGMRTIGWLPSGGSDSDLADRARAAGVELIALSEFTMRHTQPGALILGFAGCSPAELRRGVGVLAKAAA
jgi:GntR family transcriptional regulator/MocR family aminotransferase